MPTYSHGTGTYPRHRNSRDSTLGLGTATGNLREFLTNVLQINWWMFSLRSPALENCVWTSYSTSTPTPGATTLAQPPPVTCPHGAVAPTTPLVPSNMFPSTHQWHTRRMTTTLTLSPAYVHPSVPTLHRISGAFLLCNCPMWASYLHGRSFS
jgi:hypothetical protein